MRLPKNALPFVLGLAAAPLIPFMGTGSSDADLVRSFSRTVQSTAASAAPSVVSIKALVRTRAGIRAVEGSGVILGREGLVVTNYHVAGRASDHTVLMSDGRKLKARLKGGDPETDLAVLQIDDSGTFAHLELRESNPMIGEFVLAVGNPLGFDQTVTSGIISARGRRPGVATYENFLQTDAAINPGNSGGPLIDLDGKVVGINTALEVGSGSQGLGFAIPADMVRNVVGQILEKGHVERGFLGVSVVEISSENSKRKGLDNKPHVLIESVNLEGAAERAGIRAGDIVLAIGDRRIVETYDVIETVAEVNPGDVVSVFIWREGQRYEIKVRVDERTEERIRSSR